MKTWSIAAICVIAISILFAPPAMAQCPAGLPSPVFLLNGTSWAFEWTGDVTTSGMVGIFTAQVNPLNSQLGVLNITMTSNTFAGVVARRQPVQGRYQVYPDCSGGELLFNAGGNAFQFEFVFVSGKSEMYFVTDNGGVPNFGQSGLVPGGAQVQVGNRGRAKLTPQLGCPAGLTSPLQLLAGTAWGFHADSLFSGRVGDFTASISSGAGVLAVTETITSFSSNGNTASPIVVRRAQHGGRYQVYADCSGGELLFDLNGFAAQYEFVFVDGGNEMFFVADSPIQAPTNNTLGPIVGETGGAKKI